nr:ATP synthase subunit 8 [Thasus sp. CMF 0292]
MPQMAPLTWELMYVMFLMLFIMMNIMMFYTGLILPKPSSINQINTNQMIWKW